MKKITLLIAFFAITTISAQTTFDLDWKIGINGSDASITIEVGDAVRWTLRDNIAHTISSIAGSSVETFDSGTISGEGTEYLYVFTVEGSNDYKCNFHPNMNGTITVENTMSVTDKFVKNLKLYPNPVKNDLTIFSLFKVDSYQIYNVLGTLVSEGRGAGNITQVDMSKMNSGLYFVKVSSNNLQTTLKIAKK
ncbi:plastocyanin [Aequorivita sublithincola DSM 14238]|uniref:Plastocyanin n=1 Tax=Aequorivita sublithincola (strain DSM 14238 / LMG 21431 / ACAM 643 / 9-3) TaxID=746697 RepID=I3YZM9_AEQSU|nr:T9SS type A sorting domain-containing protein [Aequorivita sublithincola]AFL82447.1 plastocyanin [Aequorivita sublithincola DSM 14238]